MLGRDTAVEHGSVVLEPYLGALTMRADHAGETANGGHVGLPLRCGVSLPRKDGSGVGPEPSVRWLRTRTASGHGVVVDSVNVSDFE